MKRWLIALAICGPLVAQTPNPTVCITGGTPPVTKCATFALSVPTFINSLTCDQKTLQPGGTSICTITLNQTATAAFPIAIVAGSPLTTSAPTLTIPVGGTAATFVVTYPIPTGTADLSPTAISVGAPAGALPALAMIDNWKDPLAK